MQLRNWLNLVLLSCTVATAFPAFAGFTTYSKTWPDDACVVNEQVRQDADMLPPEAQVAPVDTNNYFQDIEPRVNEINRLYAKLGAMFATAQLRRINNVSNTAFYNYQPSMKSTTDNYVSWEAGLGTKMKAFRWELSYMYEKTLHYSPNPVLTGRAEAITSNVYNQTIWLGVNWDIDKFTISYFTPYIGGMIGATLNKTRTVMTGGIADGIAENHTKYNVAWAATFGVRMPFWTRWFGYASFNYVDQGMTRWKDHLGQLSLKGHYVMKTVNVGVQYLLG